MSTTSYTDTNNVVYTYTVPESGNTGTAFVDLSPDATGVINILSTFDIDSVTYTVTSIENDAFNGNDLSSVIIPNTVISIGTSSFNNTGILSINIPDSVTSIGDNAFAGNKITTANIGKNVTTIGAFAFSTNSISVITIPDKVVTIGGSAFLSNSANTLTIVGTDVTTIGASAFQNNNITELFIPVSVISIGSSAFRSNKLNKVYFFNIPTFGTSAFAGNPTTAPGLTAFYIDTSTSAKISSLPAVFTTKTPMTRIELLKNQIIQGVTVQYLLNDNFTLADMISAEGSADWLLTYYSLQVIVDAGFPVSSFFVSSTITLLSLVQCGISIVTLKNAGADTKRMLNEFLLSELVTIGYTALELKTASESTTSPVVTSDKKVTISALKALNVNVSQMLDAYLLSELISNDYRVSVLYDAKTTLTLSDFVTAGAPLWDLLNNYALNLLVPHFSVAQVITSSNEKVSGVFRVTDTAKQELNLKAGTLKTAGFDIKEMMNSFSLSDLIAAGYSVSELKAASESLTEPVVTSDNKVTIQKFKLAGANVSQMLDSYLLSELISNDYRVSVLYDAKTTLTLSDFVTAGAPLWDLLNHYSLHDLLAYPFSVSQLISASNEKDDLNNYKVTVINYQQLDLKAEAFREAGNAPISQLLDFFLLSGFISGGYSVSFLLTNKPTLTLLDFVNANAPLWDLMNNYALNLLIPYFTVAQLVDASNEKDAGVYKVTDVNIQSLDLKAGTLKAVNADIKQMMNAFSLSDLITAGYHVDDLIIASNDTNEPVVTASNKVTITKFKNANAPKTEMMNAYSLADLFYYGYSVLDIINTSKLTENGVFLVINTNNQSLDTKPKTLKDALAPTVQMLNYFTLSTLLNTPVSYTVAELKQASASSDVLEANKVSVLKFKNTFVTIGVVLNTSLVSMFGSYSLAELLIEYTVPELAGYDSSITIMNFYNSSADISQMIAYFPLIDLVSANIYNVSIFISNNKTPQMLVDAGMDLWKMLNEFNGGIGYLRQANSTTALLSISQLLDAVSNSNTDINKRGLISTSFYLGTGAPFSKPNNVDTPTTAQIDERNYDIFNNSTLIQLLKVSDYSVDYIITTGNSNNVTNLVHKNLNVQSFIDVSNADSFIYQNRLSNFIDYFLLSNLVNNWSVSDLKIKGASGLVSDEKVVTLARLKIANAPIWDMLSNFTLAQLVNAGYTSTQLVPVSSEKNLDESYKVTQVANRDITLTTIIGAGAPLYDLMNYYTLTQLIDVPYSVSDLITESNLKDADDNYRVTVTEYQQLNLKAGTFKNANALVSQMVESFLLPDLIVVDYRVSVLKTANSAYTKQNFKDAQAPLWDILNNYPLTELYDYYSVLELKNTSYDSRVTVLANKVLTAEKFSQNSAPLWDMLNAYSTLSDLVPYYTTSQLITASQDSRVTVTSNQNLTLIDFKDAGENLWDLLNSYSLSELLTVNFLVADLITNSQDSRVTVTANQNLNIAKFKASDTNNNKLWDIVNNYNLSELVVAGYTVDELKGTFYDVRVLSNKTVTLDRLKVSSASIPQMLNAYPLADLIIAGYTVAELITASADASVTADNKVTIATFKLANAPKTEMLNAYLLADLISAGYTVAELITASADASVTADNKVSIAKFKDAFASIPQMLNAFLLADLISAGYTVAELITASADASVTADNKVSIAKFKTANASIPEMLNAFPLADLISARYTVAQLITASADASVTNDNKVSIAKFKLANAPVTEMLNAFPLADLISAGYTVAGLITASADASVTPDNKVSIAKFKTANASIPEMLNAFPLADLISAGYTVAELITASADASVTADNKVSIAKFKTASAPVTEMLNAFPLADLISAGYTVAQLITASADASVTAGNKVSIAKFKLAIASIPQMLNAFILAELISAGYTVAELITASADASVTADNKVTIAKFKLAIASIPQMMNAYPLDELITAGYTVAELITASADASVTAGNKVSIAKFKLANAPVTEMLSNFVLSNLVISVSFTDGYTTAILVPASSLKNLDNSYKVTQVTNRDISLSTIISAGAPLYDLMNFYTLSQLISTPVSYSVASLITASNLKDDNNNYRVTVTDYQQLDTKVLTFKLLNANVSQMVGSFTLSVLIGADYRVLAIKNASSYTITNFKNVNAPLWDMLNVYNITLLINAGYTVAELKQSSIDDSSKITSGYTNLTAANFMSYTTVNNYDNLAVDILNNFTLAQVTNITWRVSDLVRYSNLKDGSDNFRVTIASNNRSLVLNDFKTRSNAPTWDILQYYGLAAMVTGGYTVAELKQTIPFNVSIDSNKRVTIASLKIAEANINDVINNYTLRELVDNSLTTGGYTLTQLINASNSTDVPLVTSNNTVTLARLLALTPVPSLEYLLTYYTTFELIKGGITPVALANIRSNIINDIEVLGYQLKITTPQLLSATASNGVVALSINQSSGSDVSVQKYYISYTNDGKIFTPFTIIMDNTQTPSVPQLGNTLYISGLTSNKYYSFRIKASSGTVYSSNSNTIRNFFLD